jgi:hypothetical protein
MEIELFGTARMLSGKRVLQLDMCGPASQKELVRAIASACPSLIGSVLRPELDGLQESFVFNRNGLEFLTRGDEVMPDDHLLLFSSQAGG